MGEVFYFANDSMTTVLIKTQAVKSDNFGATDLITGLSRPVSGLALYWEVVPLKLKAVEDK